MHGILISNSHYVVQNMRHVPRKPPRIVYCVKYYFHILFIYCVIDNMK